MSAIYYSPTRSPSTPPTSPTYSAFSSISPRAFEKTRAVQRTPSAPPIKYTLEHSAPSSPSKREARRSILGTVAQKLPGRRKKVARSATAPINPFHPSQLLIPDVIEITANTSRLLDEEIEERERLKEAAARAIGLVDEEDLAEDAFREQETEDEDALNTHPPHDAADLDPLNRRQSPPQPNPARSTSSVSRFAGHNRTSSTLATSLTAMPIPAFPSTPSLLEPFIQKSATLPKYYPASSLRIFALAKHWKARYIVLTSPPTPHTTPHQPQPSYLHLFRTSDPEERELERLQVNEDSVVFIAEEGLVGGRKGVIKVGGAEASCSTTKKREHDAAEDPLTAMWFLQITNGTEAQSWIETIKGKILLQRSMRAGLGTGQLTGVEPRGDMDVMLSLRAQNIFSPSSPPPVKTPIPTDTASVSSRSGRAVQPIAARPNTSSSSGTIPPTQPISPAPSSAVSALKGLFGASRPRSPSAASSLHPSVISSTSDDSHTGTIEGSFAGAGTNLLLGMVQRSNSSSHGHVGDGPLTTLVTNVQPRPASTVPSVHILERKILEQPFLVVSDEPTASPASIIPSKAVGRRSLDRANRTLSLQPPPRKRWTMSQENEIQTTEFYNVSMGNVTTGSLSAVGSGNPNPSLHSMNTLGSTERQRAGSLQSISTSCSGSSELLKPARSSRRWSRQGMSLPRRTSPPAGPPPATPVPQSPGSVHSAQLPAHLEEASTSQQSLVSGLPTFSKRNSVSSVASTRTSSTSQSTTSVTRPGSSHRTSVPPPQRGPPPTSALPEPPSSPPSSPTPSKSSFAHRALRLSLMAPKPPPSSGLPPRPDEPEFSRSRRSSTKLATIPASPVPQAQVPSIPQPTPTPPPHTADDANHIRHRLRILSSSATGVEKPVGSPIGEHITPPWIQNDPSFIESLPPLQPNPTAIRALPMPPLSPTTAAMASAAEPYPEFQGLSPPPRRSSKQVTAFERPHLEESGSDKEPMTPTAAVDLADITQDLSRRGSVISLGIVSMR